MTEEHVAYIVVVVMLIAVMVFWRWARSKERNKIHQEIKDSARDLFFKRLL